MKNNISNTKTKTKSKPRMQHAFKNIREPICVDATQNTTLGITVAANSTTGTAFVTLSPLGINAPALTVSGTNVVVGGSQVVVAPSMRWLYNTSLNFGKYRVTRATAVFVGSVGSVSTGQLIVTTFKDVFDATYTPQVAYAVGPNARVFDLSSSSSKELKVPIPVDSSWKKISNNLGVPGTKTPFLGFSNQLININSVNDLAFGALTAQVVGFGPSSAPNQVGTFFIDYDIEFGDPESSALNV